jgi:hypothetical protein
MARVVDGTIIFDDGTPMMGQQPVTGKRLIEVLQLLPYLIPAIGMAGFPTRGGGGGGFVASGGGGSQVTPTPGAPGAPGASGYSGYSGTNGSFTPEAATFVVSPIPGVGDYTTIQAALDNLPAEGGFILVREGTYPITTPILLPDKPVKLVGCGNGVTTLVLGAGLAISMFYDAFDQNRVFGDFAAFGDDTAGQIFYEAGPANVATDSGSIFERIHVTSIPRCFVNDPAGFLVVTTKEFGWITAPSNPLSFACDGSGILVAYDSYFTDSNFSGTSGGFGRNGGSGGWGIQATNCPLISVGNGAYCPDPFGGVQAVNTTFIGDGTSGSFIRCSSTNSDRIAACQFNLCYVEVHFLTQFSGCEFLGANVLTRAIDVVATGTINASGCVFASHVTEAIRLDVGGGPSIITGNYGCKVTELSTSCANRYSNNYGFAGSTILGTKSIVENENYRNVVTWGADPSGATDSTAQIQAAADALPAAGGVLFFPPGSYTVSSTITLPNKSAKIMGSGVRVTTVNLGANAVAAFTVPNGLSTSRTYEFSDLNVLGTSVVGQKFLTFLDTSGFGNVTCTNVRTTDVEMPFNYAAYDQTFTNLTELACWNCMFAAPSIATATLLKSVQPAGTYNGAIETRFYGCDFYDPDTGSGDWKIDGEFDVMLEGCAEVLVLKNGSSCNGFKFSESGVWIANGGTVTLEGTSWGNWFDGISTCNVTANSVGVHGILVIRNSSRVNLIGNTIRNIKVVLDSCDRTVVNGNTFQQQAQAAANQPDLSLHLMSGTDYTEVVGNHFRCDQAAVVAVALIKVESLSNVVSENTMLVQTIIPVLEAGSADQNLYSDNVGFSGSTIIGASSMVNNHNVRTTTGNPILDDGYRTLGVDASGGAKTITLPTAASAKFRVYTIKKIDSSGNAVTVDAAGAETIDGALTKVLAAQWEKVTVESTGTSWLIIG